MGESEGVKRVRLPSFTGTMVVGVVLRLIGGVGFIGGVFQWGVSTALLGALVVAAGQVLHVLADFFERSVWHMAGGWPQRP